MCNHTMMETELLSMEEFREQIRRIMFGQRNKHFVSNKIWHMQTIGVKIQEHCDGDSILQSLSL